LTEGEPQFGEMVAVGVGDGSPECRPVMTSYAVTIGLSFTVIAELRLVTDRQTDGQTELV